MSVAEDQAQAAIQEEQLQFTAFDEEAAWSLGARLRQMAIERKLAIVIDIRRQNHPLFYAALPGTTPDNIEWVRRKSNTTFRLHKSSYAVGLRLQEKGSDLYETYALRHEDYASHGGCFPIRVIGAGLVAAVTVSGLPQRADHELAVEALCAELGRDYAALKLAE